MKAGGSCVNLAGSLLACCCTATAGSAQGVQGATFDPAPVDIRQLAAGEGRTITSMDLLTLREAKGLSISPNGKWVAFVAGQAVYETNGYRSGLFVVSTSGNHRVQSLGSAGTPHRDNINQWISESPQWSSEQNDLVSSLRAKRRPFPGVVMECRVETQAAGHAHSGKCRNLSLSPKQRNFVSNGNRSRAERAVVWWIWVRNTLRWANSPLSDDPGDGPTERRGRTKARILDLRSPDRKGAPCNDERDS